MTKKYFPYYLLFAYLALFIFTAIQPFARDVWVAENIPIVLIVATLILLYIKGQRFSNTAYALMSVLIFMHTIGGYYTFERVPFDFVTNLFGFERNHYDRIAHFSVGFYAYAIAELLESRRLVNSRVITVLFAVFAIFTVASAYEIIEWWYAASADPSAGAAFLGSQGDIWDAQKDMLADGSGAIAAVVFFVARCRPRTRNL